MNASGPLAPRQLDRRDINTSQPNVNMGPVVLPGDRLFVGPGYGLCGFDRIWVSICRRTALHSQITVIYLNQFSSLRMSLAGTGTRYKS